MQAHTRLQEEMEGALPRGPCSGSCTGLCVLLTRACGISRWQSANPRRGNRLVRLTWIPQNCATGDKGSSLRGGCSEPAVAQAAQAFCAVLRPTVRQSLLVTFAR